MKIYAAGLMDKSLRSVNAVLRKQLASDYRKNLRIPSSAVISRELNTFIILSAEKEGKGALNPKIIEEIERGSPYKHFRKYYSNNEYRLRRDLRSDQELRETSHIVKNFIKEIDPNLAREFNAQLQKISKELPTEYTEIHSRSYVVLWDFFEDQKYRFFLSGFVPVFTGSTSETPIELGELVDKLVIVNFLAIFLGPTIARLQGMARVLDKLELGIKGTYFKSTNQRLQEKLEWFLRILEAKLSALQDIDSSISRIFDLFEVPRASLTKYNLEIDSQGFDTALTEIASEIKDGKALLYEVRNKLRQCQIHLRDYLDERTNEIIPTDSVQEFKLASLTMAELGVDLFVEAELLKMWTDFFGSDVPYFSFKTQLFDSQDSELIDTPRDTILAVRGLMKNYDLGRTTAYAVRGVDLDIKEGEFVAILGNSGAGKTTLLNCIAGLDTPDYGTVLFRGENLHNMMDSAKSRSRLLEMGFIFQSYALLPTFTARENVALPADLAGLSKDLKNRIESLLDGVGIDQQADQYPAQLSGGEMQRVAIARALTNRPAVIFADEPTGDLDSATGKQVMDLIKKFHEETKTTIILITHEQDVADYAERQIIMEDGVITSPRRVRAGWRREVETTLPSKEKIDRRMEQYTKFLLATLAAEMTLMALTFIMLLQIDQIVHVTVYSNVLQFSNIWSLQYWNLLRFANIMDSAFSLYMFYVATLSGLVTLFLVSKAMLDTYLSTKRKTPVKKRKKERKVFAFLRKED